MIDYCPRMQLVNDLMHRYNYVFDNFENTYFVCLQHALSSNVDMIKGLVKVGYLPKNFYFIGKSYSTVLSDLSRLNNEGVHVYGGIWSFRPGYYSESLLEIINVVWNDILKNDEFQKSCEQLIILDDGGILINSVPYSVYNKCAIFAVEQTKSGIKRLQEADMLVVNIAENEIK